MYEILAKHILYFPGVVKNSREIINFVESNVDTIEHPWESWHSNSDLNSHQYGVMRLLQPQIPEMQKMFMVVDYCFTEYYKNLGLDTVYISNKIDSQKQNRPGHVAIKKYFNGETLGPHPDWEDEDPVAFTASIYFNEDYFGGEIAFPQVDVSIKPTPGSIVIFPSNYIHESKPVNGIKYVTNILETIPKSILDSYIIDVTPKQTGE